MQKDLRLTDQIYWQDQQPKTIILPKGGRRPSWYRHIERYLQPSTECSCLEIGVVPGATLLFIAKQLGYACTGIDFSDSVNSLAEAFAAQEVKAEFIQQDFFTWQTDRQFDFVYSFGFIEHFEDYQQVLELHWSLVKPGGMLLVSVPTMTVVQKMVRRIFYTKDKMNSILKAHNKKIMNLRELKQTVLYLPKSELKLSGYISEMNFWFNAKTPGVRTWLSPLFKIVLFISRKINNIGVSSRFYSPEAYVFLKKNVRDEGDSL